MSRWPSSKASRVLAALYRIGWQLRRQSGSHRTLSRDGWQDVVFAFHDNDEIGPRLASLQAMTSGAAARRLAQRQATTHAARSPDHFTQSAGLIAAHPIADALADEYPFFSWFLRAHAFVRFRYDPDSVFSCVQDPLGFAVGSSCEILCPIA